MFDQQCIKNWATSAALKFSGPAVQHGKSKRYFAKTQRKTINFWRHNVLDIAANDNIQVRKKTLKKKKIKINSPKKSKK